MSLPTVQELDGVRSNWDWKTSQVELLKDGVGMDYFSQQSVTPDTMLLMAGPPRAASGFTEMLSPIGLVHNVQFSTDNQLQPHWEMGTDMTYFTRGKAMHTMQIGAMVANKPSLMKLLSRASPSATEEFPKDQSGQFWMNLDSDTLSKPFGILMIFKTKSSFIWPDQPGDFVGGTYLENCNIGSFSWGMESQSVSLHENISIMFDRSVPVDYSEA